MSKEQKIIKVKKGDRVCCPTKEQATWNLHPRVYLDLKDKDIATCPYCGTVFKVAK